MTKPAAGAINPRLVALNVIDKILNGGAYINLALKDALLDNRIKPVDKHLIAALVYGVVKYKLNLDYVISEFSKVKLKKLSRYVLLILRMGVYQLLYLDRIPPSAAVNESVKLAERYAYRSKGFINGVLRSIEREKDKISYPAERADYLSVRHSYPRELVEMWIEEFGEKGCEQLLLALNLPPRLVVRVNTLKTTRQRLVEILKGEGVEAEEGEAEQSLVLSEGVDISGLESYKEGLFIPQAIGSQLSAQILDPREGMFVMDLCAAPGGKTTHLAQLMNNKGRVAAFDIYQHKIALIGQNVRRMGIDIVGTSVQDATKVVGEYIGKADRVLIDAPCSGLGMIGKKPDIKWGFDIKAIPKLARLQYAIFSAGAKYVKAGGELVYSTCTIGRAENQDMRSRFLEEHLEFEPVSIEQFLPDRLRCATARDGFVQLLPGPDGGDGFFICKFRKRQQ